MVKIGGPLMSLEAHGWLGGHFYGHFGVVPNPYPIGFLSHINYPYKMTKFNLRPYASAVSFYYNALGWCYQRRRTWHGSDWAAIHPPISVNKHSSKQQGQMQQFYSAVKAWQGFTPVEKSVYNAWSYPRHASGYNRFIHWFMGLGQSMPLYWGSLDRSATDASKIQDAAVMVDSPHTHYPFNFNQYQLFNAVLHQGAGFPPTPVEGQLFWRADENKAYIYDGSAWKVYYPVAGGTDTRIATVLVAVDGTGDYTDIQDGIDALPAGGGLVFVKDGTYEITSPIVIAKSNVTLQGAGRNTIVHVNANPMNYPVRIGDYSTPFSGIIIRDLNFDFNSAITVPVSGMFVSAGISDIQILNNRFHDGNTCGLDIGTAGPNVLIQGNLFEGNVGYGMSTGYCDGVIIANNEFVDNDANPWPQLFIASSYNPIIQGNTFHHNGGATAAGDILFVNIRGGSIIGNKSEGAYRFLETQAAMSVTDQLTVSGNTIKDCYDNAIDINTGNSLILGNIIYDCGGHGIRLLAAGVSVIGNKIEKVMKNCIYIDGDQCVITGNIFADTMQETIYLYSAGHNVISDNTWVEPKPAAANTYTSIYIKGLVGLRNVYNLISRNQIRGRSVANFFKFAIGEADEYSDFNDISGNHSENIQTKDIYLRGPNTWAHDNFYF